MGKRSGKFIQDLYKNGYSKNYKIWEKKNFYSKKNIVGIDIKPIFPQKPDITIKNNFDQKLKKISSEIITLINKKI